MIQQKAQNELSPSERQEFNKLIERLPMTLRPAPHQQLNHWESLFPIEQRNALRFLRYLASLSEAEFEGLTSPLRQLETKMGVPQWHFSTQEETIENASQLARSAYYQEWRQEVQKIFDAATKATPLEAQEQKRNRLVLLIFPESLPLSEASAWKHWHGKGSEVKISDSAEQVWKQLLYGDGANLLSAVATRPEHSASDVWLIDGGSGFPAATVPAHSLSYVEIKGFRETFLERMNTIQKDLTVADNMRGELEKEDWSRWWPPSLTQQKLMREFLVALFLSGNGASVFSNSFVEWASVEAIRRARPTLVAARFGLRSKPKPFTSVAILENQEKVSPLPDIDDPEGSAVDAAILAPYIWLSTVRYQEYSQAVCLCLSERLKTMRVLAPQGHPLLATSTAKSSLEIANLLREWMRA